MKHNEHDLREQLDCVMGLVEEQLDVIAKERARDLNSVQVLVALCRSQKEILACVPTSSVEFVHAGCHADDEPIGTPPDPAPAGFCTLSSHDWCCPVCDSSEVAFRERVTGKRARPRKNQALILQGLPVICERCGYADTTGGMAEHIQREKLGIHPLPVLVDLRRDVVFTEET